MGRAGAATEMRAIGFEPWDALLEEIFGLMLFLEVSLCSFVEDIEILSSKLVKVELLCAAGRGLNGFWGGVTVPMLEVLIALGFGARTWTVHGWWWWW